MKEHADNDDSGGRASLRAAAPEAQNALNLAPFEPEIVTEFDELVRRNRRRCLWFMRDDYAPVDAAGMLKVLRNLEQHGDRETFIQARRLARCLSQHSNAVCARS